VNPDPESRLMEPARWTRVVAPTLAAALALAPLALAPALAAQTYPRGDDPRDALKPGLHDAGVATKGMRLVSHTGKPAPFDTARGLTFVNSDLAFKGNLVYQGNFAGFAIWDVSDPARPVQLSVVECITSQGDPSIYGNLLFISAEGGGNRNDCAKGGVQNPADHMAGVRIYDVLEPARAAAREERRDVQGLAHAHARAEPARHGRGVPVRVGQPGRAARRELAGCRNGADPADTTNSLYRPRRDPVPLARPQTRVVTGRALFTGLGPAPRAAAAARGRARSGRRQRDDGAMAAAGPRNCHDVTAYPAMGLLAGACASHGLLVDISNPEQPSASTPRPTPTSRSGTRRCSATTARRSCSPTSGAAACRPTARSSTRSRWAATPRSPSAPTGSSGSTPTSRSRRRRARRRTASRTTARSCPIPGRDVMVQGWYQGGVDVIDFTDPDKPVEIAFFDRGPVDLPPPIDQGPPGGAAQMPRGTIAGSWGAYWYNGRIYSSEMARGLDILELTPSENLSANEIAAAKLVRMAEFNPQSQPRIVWPAAFPVVRSYLDQLVRGGGLAAARTTAVARRARRGGAAVGRRAARGADGAGRAGGRRRGRRQGRAARARDGGGDPRPGGGVAVGPRGPTGRSRPRPAGRRPGRRPGRRLASSSRARPSLVTAHATRRPRARRPARARARRLRAPGPPPRPGRRAPAQHARAPGRRVGRRPRLRAGGRLRGRRHAQLHARAARARGGRGVVGAVRRGHPARASSR
jgi:hypothetical protein